MKVIRLSDEWVRVELTERNLRALLLKLARPDSHRIIFAWDGLVVEVKAVPDTEHYSDREPGRMAEPEETALKDPS